MKIQILVQHVNGMATGPQEKFRWYWNARSEIGPRTGSSPPSSLVSPTGGLAQGWESVCWAVGGPLCHIAEDANHPSGRCKTPKRKMQTTRAEDANRPSGKCKPPERKMQTTHLMGICKFFLNSFEWFGTLKVNNKGSKAFPKSHIPEITKMQLISRK